MTTIMLNILQLLPYFEHGEIYIIRTPILYTANKKSMHQEMTIKNNVYIIVQ